MNKISKVLGLLIVASFLISSLAYAKYTRVNLLTAKPGKSILTAFGHTALELVDEKRKRSRVFEYGAFQINVLKYGMNPKLIVLDTMDGKIKAKKQVVSGRYFRYRYKRRGQQIMVEKIRMPQRQIDKLLNLLSAEFYNSRKRTYFYDHFKNNCVTRIRDLIWKAKRIKPRGWRRASYQSIMMESIRAAVKKHGSVMMYPKKYKGVVEGLAGLGGIPMIPQKIYSARGAMKIIYSLDKHFKDKRIHRFVKVRFPKKPLRTNDTLFTPMRLRNYMKRMGYLSRR